MRGSTEAMAEFFSDPLTLIITIVAVVAVIAAFVFIGKGIKKFKETHGKVGM